ncbi:tetratricopeptide repeat protein [candidate division WOR-3 bacterium]|nr:tetratricopeptide repeat protein [candidate division WOR-3 bacterium]
MPDKVSKILYEKENVFTEEDKASFLLGKAKEYFDNSNFASSFNAAVKALEISERAKIENKKRQALLRLGFVSYAMSDFDKALGYFHKASEGTPDIKTLTSSYEGMAIVFVKIGLKEKALDLMKKSLELREREGVSRWLQQSCNNIANIYRHFGEFEKSLEYLRRAENLATDDKRALAYIYNNIGEVYREKGDLEESLKFYKKSLSLKKGIKNKLGMTPSVFNIGLVMEEKGEYKTALKYIKKAFDSYSEIGNKLGVANTAKSLSNVYEKRKNYKKALFYSRIFTEKAGEIFNEEKAAKIAEMDARFEIKVKERENAIYKMKNEELAQANTRIQSQKDELEKKNEELVALNRSKDVILRLVSHDLKGTIGSLLPLIDIFLEVNGFDEDSENTLEVMKHYIERALVLVNDILEVNKIESEDFSLSLEKYDVACLISEFSRDFQNLSEKKEIKFTWTNKSGSLLCMIDLNRFWQILQNLFSNALKFTKRGGRIDITLTEEFSQGKKRAIISISDNGIGIPDKIKSQIFDKFTQARRMGTEGEKTTGLGLSIVKRLVELHNGQINVFSEEGSGSVFSFSFPVVS